MSNLLVVIVSYLTDSLSLAVTVSKCYGMADPRIYGSGNPGATNALRSDKKKVAVLVLLGDALKGVFAIAAVRLLRDNLGLSDGIIATAAVAVLAGHMWPVFFGLKGGKGVATASGMFSALSWPTALICVAAWLVMALGFKVSSSAALTTTVISPFIAYFSMPHGSWVVATAIITMLALYRHKSNIENLFQGKKGEIGDKAEN